MDAQSATGDLELDTTLGHFQAEAPSPLTFLSAVDDRIERILDAQTGMSRVILDAIETLVFAPDAKRARPMLIDTLARATFPDRRAAIDFAAAVELVHTASLLHDDVIDGADVRRARPTANALHGNAIAVLAGDLALTLALDLVRPWGQHLLARTIATVGEMTAGVADEVLARRASPMAIGEWRAMAERKTGALFGLAAWLVAWPDSRAERFDRALRHLGVAFQIADDAAEIAANARSALYRSSDLVTGNPNFCVSVVHERANPGQERDVIEAFLARPTDKPLVVQEVAAAVVALGGLDAARTAIAAEIRLAREAFGFAMEHEAVQVVLNWADTLVAF